MSFLKYTLVTTLCGISSLVFGNNYTSNYDYPDNLAINICGYVIDAQTQLPLADASIKITRNATELNTTTDAGGFFQIMVDSSGLHTFIITKTSYYTLRLDEIVTQIGKDTFLFALEPDFSIFNDITTTFCEGETFQIGNNLYGTTGLYMDTLVSSGGCDSIITLDLTVLQVPDTVFIDTVICPENTIIIGASIYFQSGYYHNLLEAQNTCDSIVILNLRVTETFIDTTICLGDTVNVGSESYHETGVYPTVLIAANGCDSIVTLNLKIGVEVNDIMDTVVCTSFWPFTVCANGITSGQDFTSIEYWEGFENGLGSWTQGLNGVDDNRNWTRDAGGTPSPETGPTSGANGSSWYLYTEASGVNPGETYMLKSQVFDLSQSNYQLTFYYHMYSEFSSAWVGSLSVDVSTDGTNWDNIWSLSGNQGNQWHEAKINLNQYSGCSEGSDNVQIRFVSIRGDGFQSDIAIDDIFLKYDLLYSWSTGYTGPSIEIDTTNFPAFSSQSYVVTVTNPIIGCSAVDSFLVTHASDESVVLNRIICEGDSIMFNGTYLTEAGTYLDTLLSSQGCDSTVELNVTNCDTSSCVTLNLTVFLQGPFNSGGGDMDDLLRMDSLIPLTEPYTGLGYTQVGGDSALATDQSIIDSDSIVDWVWIELRDASDSTNIIATQAGLLKSNGTVINYNGDDFSFKNLAVSGAPYFIAVRHRNHLGIMTANTFILTSGGTAVDFTTMSDADVYDKTAGYDGNEMDTISGVKVMHMGDTGGNGGVQYQGPTNDVDGILASILADPANLFNFITFNSMPFYNSLDPNLDGVINYQGPGNDSDPLSAKIFAFPPNIFNFITFEIIEQLP